MKSKLALAVFFLSATMGFTACEKDNNNPNNPSGVKRWIKTYRDVVLNDDSVTTGGQFLDTRTGIVYKLRELPDSMRRHVSLCYNVTQGGSYIYLSTTGSISGTASGKSGSLLWTGVPYGLNYWSPADMNTFEARIAAYGSPEMTAQEFENVATSGSWEQFNTIFKLKNSGAENLSFSGESVGLANSVYLGEINNALRVIIYNKSHSSDPASGFVKFDIIVEGRSDAPSGAANIMPPM